MPTPRGREGGRKPKHILPTETGITMKRTSLRLRSDVLAHITKTAKVSKVSKDEYVMRQCAPAIMKKLDAQRKANASDQIREV